ncbi:MAG: copper-translocating P-type ATPase [Candidatus Moranbacteria bacterium]|nr:copper-translocating P-type ATPase [Candidatus Moranbacteria bacterium]
MRKDSEKNYHNAKESSRGHHRGHDSGHEGGEHSGHSVKEFKERFFVSLALTVPVLLLSPLVQDFLGFSFKFAGSELVLFLLSTAVFFYGGKPFYMGAYRELKEKNPGMMTLIALAIVVAYIYSGAVVFGLEGKFFFWELVTLIDVMLLGHWIEMKSVAGASKALEKLSALIPDKAHFKKDGEFVEVETGRLEKGNVILVKPGEKIPADGVVVRGKSFVNESMLTGESKPVAKTESEEVIGGSVNGEGSLEIEITQAKEDSYLSKVMNLVRQAQSSKSKTQALADKAAFWLTMIAIAAGAATFVGWLVASGELAFAIERTATVLVITCPHALGLAIPLVAAGSTAIAASNGLLIKNRTSFENARKITTVVFDKTGTLTEGVFKVKEIISIKKGWSEEDVLKIAASLEKNSEHPIGKAVVAKAEEAGIELFKADNFQAIKGKGIGGKVGGRDIIAAGPGYLAELGLEKPQETVGISGTAVYLIEKKKNKKEILGFLSLSDSIRKESKDAVEELKKKGIKIWMLTGDNEETAREVSEELGLDGFFAGVLPEEKQAKIKELQGKDEYVAMAGDGINDAPALAQADVGIAIGSGTDVAGETADIILVNNNPGDILTLISFGRKTYKKMIQNLIWATGYNVFAIPLAAGVLAGYGILLSPAVGAVLMSLSTVVVAVNAKMLTVSE